MTELERAALLRLRQPTVEMMVMLVMHIAAARDLGTFGVEEATKAWQAVIDVALEV